jgi:SPP1 family predicted phage head-tail adaptor
MNPGQFNKRIKFIKITGTPDIYGGRIATYTDFLTTWGSLEPMRQYNQLSFAAGTSELNEDVILKLRYRESFRPDKTFLFVDVSDPTEINAPIYSIKSVLPYYPGTKIGFENNQETAYQNKLFIYIIGVKTEDSYLNLFS